MDKRTEKIILISVSAAIVVAAGLYIGSFWFKNLRGVGPAINPPPADIVDIVGTEEGPLSLPEGFSISVFADDLVNPRDMALDPSGVIVVSVPSDGKVFALPDNDGDGKADEAVMVAEGLNRPHGIAFHCDDTCQLYIAETDKVSVYDYDKDNFRATGEKKILDLPAGGGHFTRSILMTEIDGVTKLLVSVGSSCNVCDESDWRRAKVISYDPDGSDPKVFASGLRNSVFMTLRPGTKEIWATEMGRDLLGDDIPPDEINILKEGGNYGWPICYGKNIHDTNFDKKTYFRDPCSEPLETESLVDIPAHSAPLGLAFLPEMSGWPEEYEGDLFVAFHGSWNRSVPTGYKVVRYKIDGGVVTSPQAEDFVSGWLIEEGATGRPADIIFSNGKMFVSDDKAGVIYSIAAK